MRSKCWGGKTILFVQFPPEWRGITIFLPNFLQRLGMLSHPSTYGPAARYLCSSAMYSNTIRLAHAHTDTSRHGRHMVCDFAVSILLPGPWHFHSKLTSSARSGPAVRRAPPRSVCRRRAAISLGVKIMDGNKLRLFIGLIQSACVWDSESAVRGVGWDVRP